MDTVLLIFEIIGTVAFALSGAATAVKSDMDVFGIIICGLTTAVGGGCIRDIILGVVPPLMFINPIYSVIAAMSTLLIFIPALRDISDGKSRFKGALYMSMDAVGLGVFTVVGVHSAYLLYPDNIFLMVFVGVLSGVGGGVLRDLFTQKIPYIFVKHIYATASIVGALVCAFLLHVAELMIALSVGFAVVIVIRALAIYFHLNLPHA